jgi:hypothetical protein
MNSRLSRLARRARLGPLIGGVFYTRLPAAAPFALGALLLGTAALFSKSASAPSPSPLASTAG